MANDFLHSTLGRTGRRVFRLGLSASYRPGRDAIVSAIDHGVNYFFAYGFDSQMLKTLRDVFKTRRDELLVATGGYNWILWRSNLRRALESRLRQLRTDHIDVFMFLGVMKPEQFPESVREEMVRFREEGKVRAIGISTHDRKLAGRLARDGALDLLMVRYNAAHRGAETDIFPYLKAHDPGIVCYTATRWSFLLRPAKGWPKERPIPTAGLAYRFVLANPHVDVVLSAPTNAAQLAENLAEIEKGPLTDEEMNLMREYGDAVHAQKKWFM